MNKVERPYDRGRAPAASCLTAERSAAAAWSASFRLRNSEASDEVGS